MVWGRRSRPQTTITKYEFARTSVLAQHHAPTPLKLLKPWLIADLLVLNEQMPRSLASCYENLTAFLDELSLAYGRQGPAQRIARSIRTRLQNSRIADIFQKKGLHEFLTEFIRDNAKLGAAIIDQYLT